MPVSIRDDYPALSAQGGQCYSCSAGRRDVRDPDGTLRKERVVDLGVSIDMEGYLMVCETCTVEAGRLLGLVSPEERDDAIERLALAEAECQRLLAERDEAKLLVRALRGYDANEAITAVELEPEPVSVPTDTPAPARETRTRKAAAKP